MPRSTDPLVIGGVIGDVLEPFTTRVSLRILYNNSLQVINCCELKPYQILNQPRVEIGGDDLRTLYTLVYLYMYITAPVLIILLFSLYQLFPEC